ncbi:MAG: hypothetical protein ACR2PL_02625 [Dehalococcoidia bacterium]
MLISSWLRRIVSPRPERRSVELDPVQQWAVLTLARFGSCDFQRLHAEVHGIRGSTPADLVIAITKLERDHLLERLANTSDGRQDNRYRLSRVGRRAARVIPRPPRSAINFYV